jgi:hypothetical protein
MVILGLLLPGLLSGCGSSEPDKIAGQFTEMISEEASAETIKAADEFLEDHLDSLNQEQAGELLMLLEEYALNYDNSSLDYADVIERFGQEIPPYMTELFELKRIEQNAPIISDATLQVSWDELLARTENIEDFIVRRREDVLIKDDALWLYRRHINALLMGAINSPVFDYDTREFSPELKTIYERAIAERPDSALTWVLKEYVDYLESMDYVLLYRQKEDSAKFIETCNRLASEAEKRVYSADQ